MPSAASVLALLVFILGLRLSHPLDCAANLLGRDSDPVIVSGVVLGPLIGASPDRIRAYRYSGGWVPILVQVDERAAVDFGAIYDSTAIGLTVLTYTDTSTFTGGDPGPAVDGDDEVVFMARDAGDGAAAVGLPDRVLPGSGVRVTITNPLTGARGYAFLFVHDGSPGCPPPAGACGTYDFNLLSGNYKATYNVHSGPNRENSRVTAAAYQVHFADRWIRDETRVSAGGSSAVDILDRHKDLFAPGNCTRSENTFSEGEGAFIVNRSCPVRGLRGYVGCNSGPTSYRVHAFYEAREEILTALRVHPVPSLVDYFDYSPAASGMIYRNNLNPAGVTIDGSQDAVTPARFVVLK